MVQALGRGRVWHPSGFHRGAVTFLPSLTLALGGAATAGRLRCGPGQCAGCSG